MIKHSAGKKVPKVNTNVIERNILSLVEGNMGVHNCLWANYSTEILKRGEKE